MNPDGQAEHDVSIFEAIIFAPRLATKENPSRFVRVLGVALFMIWLVPALLLCAIPFLAIAYFAMFPEMFVSAWRGP